MSALDEAISALVTAGTITADDELELLEDARDLLRSWHDGELAGPLSEALSTEAVGRWLAGDPCAPAWVALAGLRRDWEECWAILRIS